MRLRLLCKGSPDQISGGYLYNKYLIEHLRGAGHDVVYHGDMPDLSRFAPTDVLIVDSLVLEHYATRLLHVPSQIVLLLHVLPRFLELPACRASLLPELLRRSRIVVTGDDTARRLTRLAGGIAVDAARIEPGIRSDWQPKSRYAARASNLLCVSNYVRGKGIRRLLALLARLRDLSWRLTVHGSKSLDPAYYGWVAQFVEASGLGDRVDLAGPTDHRAINHRMRHSDLLLQFSSRESYSMVTAEAIACGLPVLSFRTGNHMAFVRSGLVRYVDIDGDSQRAALADLIADETAYGRLRCRSRQQVRPWYAVGTEFLNFLDCHGGARWPRTSLG